MCKCLSLNSHGKRTVRIIAEVDGIKLRYIVQFNKRSERDNISSSIAMKENEGTSQ